MILPIRSVIFTPVTPVAPVRGPDGSETNEYLAAADRERQKRRRRPRQDDAGARMTAVSPSVFDPGNFDTTAAKVDLAERLGRGLGLRMGDFRTVAAFLDAVESAVAGMDPAVRERLADEAGLTVLDLSPTDLVAAMRRPGSADSEAVDAALRRQASGRDAPPDHDVHIDDAGLYGT